MFRSAALNAAVQQDVLTFSLHRKKKKKKRNSRLLSLWACSQLSPHFSFFFLFFPLHLFFSNDCVLMKVPFYVNLVMLWHLQISQQDATVATRQAHKELSGISGCVLAAHRQPEDLNNNACKASPLPGNGKELEAWRTFL